LEFLASAAIEMQCAHPAITFHHPEHDSLVGSASSVNLFCAFTLVHVAGFPADERLIDFDLSVKLAVFTLHCEPDAVKHEPRGFLSHAKRAMKLPRANPVLVVYDHPDRGQPLIQPERGVLENSASFQGELRTVVFAIAFPHTGLFEIDHVVGIAARAAHNALWPTKLNHELAAVLEVFEVDNRFSQCASKFHDSDISNRRLVCQVYSCPNIRRFGTNAWHQTARGAQS